MTEKAKKTINGVVGGAATGIGLGLLFAEGQKLDPFWTVIGCLIGGGLGYSLTTQNGFMRWS